MRDEAESTQLQANYERAREELHLAYEGISPGDPRLMALWDLGDSLDAEGHLDRVNERLESEPSSTFDPDLMMAVVRAQQVKNRIDMRSTDTPNYALAMMEAQRYHRQLKEANVKIFGIKSGDANPISEIKLIARSAAHKAQTSDM